VTEKTRNLFISHVHEDDEKLQPLKDLLKTRGWNVRDGSIDSSKPNKAENKDYIKYKILAPHIDWAGAFIVLVSEETHTSEYVEWEIEYAKKEGKRIVGVYAQGGKESDLPDAFKKYGEALVGWQGDQVIGAIEGDINNWKASDGESPYGGGWHVDRYGC